MKEYLKHIFLAGESNNNQPLLFSTYGVFGSIIVVVLVVIMAQYHITIVRNVAPQQLAAVVAAVVADETNIQRLENQLKPLRLNKELSIAAQKKVDDMISKGYFAHKAPDGTEPWYFIDNAGYDCEVCGENLAVNFFNSFSVVEAWMNSPTHKDNILGKDFTDIGIAVKEGTYEGKDSVYIVQMFGRKFMDPTLADRGQASFAAVSYASMVDRVLANPVFLYQLFFSLLGAIVAGLFLMSYKKHTNKDSRMKLFRFGGAIMFIVVLSGLLTTYLQVHVVIG